MKKPNTLLETKNLGKTYQVGEVPLVALHSVNVKFNEGELTVMLGASGSGKSTLLNILGGLDTATTGEVLFHGKTLALENDEGLTRYRRNHVGFVFQFYNLIPSLTAEENVRLVTDLSDKSMTPLEALTLVKLADRKNHFPAQLSGGEQQRVAIARAIAKRPELLLCDEPTGALDFKTGRIVLEAITGINQDLGTTTVVITHNESIAQIADRIILVKDGTIVSDSLNHHKKPVTEVSW
ncbi:MULTISPECIES: ABC transporter ATP-binding protein [Leptospira]|uniref:ABC transporter ATP-binding protein n=1 Tax=Leptospira bandrabouensis TaxID=2484903 RepID=A0A6H3NT47_9LEPT|nr:MULTISPECIES: ABC transporter ATP-binding protein [Leptospira]MCG6146441.1 ABC transporter ATP-binding protein [Leptospira bandrabouensis]MCG6153967.1 ABC transporter ATP-binding protein [Leptospira bandrabouensis]MCG6161588.1 ABC transporter ATP-binding protein [Leptospira bandrabouensis]MCG6166028.1 ABC transporter ATP-binding protein [Leptospira bandrabouensis]MCW7459821.1 ABC transporter ATP-binding protein [Leptospira bandrabouensis]